MPSLLSADAGKYGMECPHSYQLMLGISYKKVWDTPSGLVTVVMCRLGDLLGPHGR